MATCHLTPKQCIKIKSFIVDTNNCLNGIFPAFNSLNQELASGFHLIDIFPDHFSFHLANCKDTNTKITHWNKLKNIYESSFKNQDFLLIISDTSVKNSITTLVLYIQRGHEIITKNVHYTINILSMEAKLFDIALVKYPKYKTSLILSSSQILSILPNISLICPSILTNYILLPYLVI